MTDEKLFIPILLGTTRKDRESEKVATLLASYIDEHQKDVQTVVVDVRDFAFPLDNYGPGIKDTFPEWKETMANADGLIIVAPEYNHGYPGPLKSVLDLLYDEYKHKVVGVASVSSGPWGGVRVIENLIPVLRELKLSPIRVDLQFPKAQEGVETEGVTERMEAFFEELLFVGRSLKWGRKNLG